MRTLHGIGLGLTLFIVACKSTEDGTDAGQGTVEQAIAAGRAACDRYLECAAATSPEAVGALLEGFGPEGTCWQTDEIPAIELCAQACAEGRANAAELFPDVGACGECASDSDCSEAPDGPRCDPETSSCVACLAAADCQHGACKPETHTCVDCIDDDGCAEGEECVGNECGPERVCSPGFSRCRGATVETCDSAGLTWDVTVDCPAEGLTCIGGECAYTDYGPCFDGGKCLDPKVCTPVGEKHGYCIPEFGECSSSLDCDAPKPHVPGYNRRCIGGKCSLGCMNGEPCPTGMSCINGTCAWPGH